MTMATQHSQFCVFSPNIVSTDDPMSCNYCNTGDTRDPSSRGTGGYDSNNSRSRGNSDPPISRAQVSKTQGNIL